MRKKLFIIISISVIAIGLIAGFFLLLKNKFKADSVYPTTTAAVNAANSFVFDSSVPVARQQFFIDSYKKIEYIYGQRNGNKIIKVFFDTDNGRSICLAGPADIIIRIKKNDWDSDHIIIHELAHAFHGYYSEGNGGQNPIWEEGMAESIAEILSPLPKDEVFSLQNKYELVNLPFNDFKPLSFDFNNNSVYYYGSLIFQKMYIENGNFFKNFNNLLYKTDPSQLSNMKFMTLIVQSVSKVEGNPIGDWLSLQYPLTPINDTTTTVPLVENYFIQNNKIGFILSPAENSNPNDASKTDQVKIFIFDGKKIVGQCIKNLNGSTDMDINPIDCKIAVNVPTKPILLKFVISTERNKDRNIVQYFPIMPFEQRKKSYITVSAPELIANKVTIENLNTGWKNNFSLIDGISVITDPKANLAGKYKITLTNTRRVCKRYLFFTTCSNKTQNLGERHFNKQNGYYNVLFQNQQNNCKITDLTQKGLKGSINLDAKLSQTCSVTWSLNNIPVKRMIGKSIQVAIDNLEKSKTYLSRISATNGWGNYTNKEQSVTTLGGEDIKIISQTNIGQLSNFRRRITFNIPYDFSSGQSLKMRYYPEQGNSQIFTDIPIGFEKFNNVTLDIIPKVSLINGGYYDISGLGSIKDSDGNLIKNEWLDGGFVATPGEATINPPLNINAYDFNCDSRVDMSDVAIISDLWKNSIKITEELIIQKRQACPQLGEYLWQLREEGNETVPINEVTKIGGEIKTSLQ